MTVDEMYSRFQNYDDFRDGTPDIISPLLPASPLAPSRLFSQISEDIARPASAPLSPVNAKNSRGLSASPVIVNRSKQLKNSSKRPHSTVPNAHVRGTPASTTLHIPQKGFSVTKLQIGNESPHLAPLQMTHSQEHSHSGTSRDRRKITPVFRKSESANGLANEHTQTELQDQPKDQGLTEWKS